MSEPWTAKQIATLQDLVRRVERIERVMEVTRPAREGCQARLGPDGKCQACGWNMNTRSYDPI
jgi:predicted Zn-ribbon and HTH transcriptional regulator